jgi:hypothetical protein
MVYCDTFDFFGVDYGFQHGASWQLVVVLIYRALQDPQS